MNLVFWHSKSLANESHDETGFLTVLWTNATNEDAVSYALMKDLKAYLNAGTNKRAGVPD